MFTVPFSALMGPRSDRSKSLRMSRMSYPPFAHSTRASSGGQAKHYHGPSDVLEVHRSLEALLGVGPSSTFSIKASPFTYLTSWIAAQTRHRQHRHNTDTPQTQHRCSTDTAQTQHTRNATSKPCAAPNWQRSNFQGAVGTQNFG